MEKYLDIEEKNISFKNLLSGPAQVGRILNYIIYAGENSLKHQPGARNDKMENNIGSAWCIEFMIGLGLVELGNNIEKSNVYYLNLTPGGRKIYNILIENAIEPNLNQDSNSEVVFEQLKKANALNIINVFEDVFRSSIIFKDLCIFLGVAERQDEYIIYNIKKFKEDLFKELKEFYEHKEYSYNGTGASTASNRVPSLLQICKFLNYSIEKDGNIYFKRESLINGIYDESYKLDISDKHFVSEYEKEEKIIEKLKNEFGISGNHIVEETVRLSQAQLIFKERLIREYGQKCAVCGIENSQLLVASHIKDSAKCDIYDKTNNNNGLLLCAMHDKLFDRGLISFDFTTGNILISKSISENDKELCNLTEKFVLPDDLMTEERAVYLIWHNNEFYSNDK